MTDAHEVPIWWLIQWDEWVEQMSQPDERMYYLEFAEQQEPKE